MPFLQITNINQFSLHEIIYIGNYRNSYSSVEESKLANRINL